MSLADDGALDPNYARILVFFNANPGALSWSNPQLPNGWKLHPILAASADPALKQAGAAGASFSIPGRSTAVFVLPKGASLAPAGGPAAGGAAATPAAVPGGGAGAAVPTPTPASGGAEAAATPEPKPLLPPTGGAFQQNPPQSPPDYGSLLGLVVTGLLGIAALFVIKAKEGRNDKDK